ncbi:MAG: M23 family metallopeptidase [Bacteroidia bacterium]|nr:M23 family metallopeptidase [Bacteroidia bacterium]
MRKIKYYYNEQTFSYEKATFSFKEFGKKLGICALGALFMAPLLIQMMNLLIGNPEEKFYQNQQQSLNQQLVEQYNVLQMHEIQLNKLHKNDNSFYRSILNMEQIDPMLWNAGTGGTPKFTEKQPEILEKLLLRAEKLLHQLNLQAKSYEAIAVVAEKKQEELKHIPAIKPTYGRITSGFGWRHDPFDKHWQMHLGLDIDAPMGAKIVAAADGIVTFAGKDGHGYGNLVDVDHRYGYKTKYAHMSRVVARVGQKVKRGDLLGYVGSTGYSTGPHLHYEVLKNGIRIDPTDFFYTK